jgi:hypothetical protein
MSPPKDEVDEDGDKQTVNDELDDFDSVGVHDCFRDVVVER